MQVDDDLCLIIDDFPCPAILVNINCFITCKNKKIVCAVLSDIFYFASTIPLAYISAGALDKLSTRIYS